jgi:hypothetical protein
MDVGVTAVAADIPAETGRRSADRDHAPMAAAKSGCIVQASMSLNCKDGVILFRIL